LGLVGNWGNAIRSQPPRFGAKSPGGCRKPRTTSGRGSPGHWPRAAAGSWSTCWCGAAVRPADRARYASATPVWKRPGVAHFV